MGSGLGFDVFGLGFEIMGLGFEAVSFPQNLLSIILVQPSFLKGVGKVRGWRYPKHRRTTFRKWTRRPGGEPKVFLPPCTRVKGSKHPFHLFICSSVHATDSPSNRQPEQWSKYKAKNIPRLA